MSSNRFASYCFLFGCAFYENNKGCPFKQLRELTIEERASRLKKMTYQEVNNFEFIHKRCREKRTTLRRKNIFY